MITITTWNVQNLAQSDPVFADKLNFLVGTLQALGSDVVNEDTPNMIGPHPTAGGVVPDHAPVTATFV